MSIPVSFYAGPGGNIAWSGGTTFIVTSPYQLINVPFESGSQIKVIGTANPGYYFSSFTIKGPLSGETADNPLSLTVTEGPFSVTANFTAIAGSVGPGGSSSGGSGGSGGSLPSTPSTGTYQFTRVHGMIFRTHDTLFKLCWRLRERFLSPKLHNMLHPLV